MVKLRYGLKGHSGSDGARLKFLIGVKSKIIVDKNTLGVIEMETIERAAIRWKPPEGSKIVIGNYEVVPEFVPTVEMVFALDRPARHHDIINLMANSGLPRESIEIRNQGFETNGGKFVSREEALQIAERAKQIVEKHRPWHQLLTEDMW